MASSNVVCDGNHLSASSTKKANLTSKARYTQKVQKKEETDTAHKILYALDVLIVLVTLALVYTFGKDIYKRLQNRKQIPLVGENTSNDF